MQLSLFENLQMVTVTYWSKPYNKKGYIDKNAILQKWTEIRPGNDPIIKYYQENSTEYKYLKIK